LYLAKHSNVRFYPTAATAQREGFRACKCCRPDKVPGSPELDARADAVGRAMRLIADGVGDREGVAGLARRLCYTERHLHRLLAAEVGAGPLALARARRVHTARLLIETTDLPVSEVTFAAGFASIRQFNDTVRQVFAATPRELRRVRGRGGETVQGEILLRLPFRMPFDADGLLRVLGARAVAGIEEFTGGLIGGPCACRTVRGRSRSPTAGTTSAVCSGSKTRGTWAARCSAAAGSSTSTPTRLPAPRHSAPIRSSGPS
jgi:AraC family transcriptional regulator, regulatory protein of adaptative response / DNA-3-methyladenine glycosylase II